MNKNKKSEIFKTEDGEKVLFIRVPLTIQFYFSALTSTAMKLYMYFMKESYYENTLVFKKSTAELAEQIGVNRQSVSAAIFNLASHGFIQDVIYEKHAPNTYVINIVPKINKLLLKKLEARSIKHSKAKKKNIENGESGKFIKKEKL